MMSKSDEKVLRVTRSKDVAKASYDKLSRWYDLIAGSEEKKFRKIALQKLNVAEGERVLEIGFGTGHALIALAKSVGSSGKVYGLDISEGMLDISQTRITKAGLSENIDLKCGDATVLPYADNFFDAVFMSFTLELFDTPEIQPVLQQCRRVLNINGRLSIVAMAQAEKSNLMTKLYAWSHKKFPNYIDCRPIFVGQSVQNAGFEIEEVVKSSTWGLPIEIVLAKKA